MATANETREIPTDPDDPNSRGTGFALVGTQPAAKEEDARGRRLWRSGQPTSNLSDLASGSSILRSPESSIASDQIKAIQGQAVALGEEMTKKRKELDTLQAENLKKEVELVKPAIGALKESVKKPLPAEPILKEEPKAPDLIPRPFLSGEGKNALQEVVQGLGLIITSIAGAKRAPQAALGALTGAMTGWAEGDAERASRSWHQYEGAVATMNRENTKALQQWERARVIRADDIQAQQILLTANLSEAHLSDHVMDLKEKGIEGLGKQLTQTESILAKIMTANERVRHDLEQEAHWRRQDARAATGGKVVGQQLKITKDIASIDQNLASMHQRQSVTKDLREAIALLDEEGAIPRGATKQEKLAASAKLNYLKMNRPDIATAMDIVNRWGTSLLIGKEIEYQMGKVGGMRFLKMAEAEAGKVLEINKPFWDKTLDQMETFQAEREKSLKEQRASLVDYLGAIHGETPTQPTQEDILSAVGPWETP